MDNKNISFSFKKAKKDSIISTLSNFDDTSIHHERDDKEDLCLIEGKKLQGLKTEKEKKEFVIPLIGSNRWRMPEREPQNPGATGPPGRDATEEQAIKEILEDVNRSNNEQSEERVVPLLVQNKVPAGYETDDKLDVSLRPAEHDVDYEEIPIAEFGKAMLRGMGWKEEKEDKKNTKMPMEIVPRPKGLGLGANRKNVQDMKLTTETGKRDGNEKEELILCKGAYCVVTSGSHKDLYGQIQGTDTENSRVIVKMTLSSQAVNLSVFAINLVTQNEYKKYSKYLNKGKSDKYKEKEAKKQQQKKQNGYDTKDSYNSDKSDYSDNDRHYKNKHKHHKHSKHDHHHRDYSNSYDTKYDSESDSVSHSRKRKHKESKRDKKSSKHRKRSSSREGSPSLGHRDILNELWLRPHLRVRVIDERYKKGKYFKEKVTVEDIASIDCCVCRTNDGRILEDLCQDQLETVVPRSQPAYVMIVSGKHKTQVAEILEKDKSKMEATVQLLIDRDIVFITQFDQICEYTGDVTTQMDY